MKSETLKKILLVVVVIALIGSIFIGGCKSEATDEKSSEETATEETASEETATEETATEETTTEETATEETTMEPKMGGSFSVAFDSEPIDLDPHFMVAAVPMSINHLFYDTLFHWNNEYTDLVPMIAESWEWVDDEKLNLKINIREGMKFHDGSMVNAEAVKYSIDRILDPANASPVAGFFTSIEEIILNDEMSIIVKLKVPWFGVFDRLTTVPIASQKAIEDGVDLKTNPVGSGPFVFDSWEEGLYIKAVKFDDYFMEDKPYLDEITVKFISEYSTQKSSLLTEDIDLIVWPSSSDYESLKANEDLELFYVDLWGMTYINLNAKVEPLGDKRVRQAIALCVDRPAYNDALYAGLGQIIYVPMLKTQEYYNPDWEYERDIEKAKELLAEAGYPDGFEIGIMALKGPDAIMGEILASNLAEIGIKGIIEVVEVPEALHRLMNTQEFDISALGDLASADPDLFPTKYLLSDGSMNNLVGNWSVEEVDNLIVEGRKEFDPEKRVEIYQKLYDIFLDENPMIFVAQALRHPVFNKYVKGFYMAGDYRYDWKSIWLDK